MDRSRSIHGIKKYRISGSSFDDSDESEEEILLKQRATDLLNCMKEPLRKRHLFRDPYDDPPKLRKSLVTRAVQDIVSSTPFLKTPNCFIDDCSLNISPINPIPEEVEEECKNYRNTGIIIISSEGEPSEQNNDEKRHSEAHFVPISLPKNKNQTLTEDFVYNRKRTDIPQSQGIVEDQEVIQEIGEHKINERKIIDIPHSQESAISCKKTTEKSASKIIQSQNEEISPDIRGQTIPETKETSKKATKNKKHKTVAKTKDKPVKDNNKNVIQPQKEKTLLDPSHSVQSPIRTRSRALKNRHDTQISAREKSAENQSKVEVKKKVQNVSSTQTGQSVITDKTVHEDDVAMTSQTKSRKAKNSAENHLEQEVQKKVQNVSSTQKEQSEITDKTVHEDVPANQTKSRKVKNNHLSKNDKSLENCTANEPSLAKNRSKTSCIEESSVDNKKIHVISNIALEHNSMVNNKTFKSSSSQTPVRNGTSKLAEDDINKNRSIQTSLHTASSKIVADNGEDSQEAFQGFGSVTGKSSGNISTKNHSTDSTSKLNRSRASNPEYQEKIKMKRKLDEIIQNLARNSSLREEAAVESTPIAPPPRVSGNVSIPESHSIVKEPPQQLKSALKSNCKKPVVNRSIRFSQPCYEDSESDYEELPPSIEKNFSQNVFQKALPSIRISTNEPPVVAKNTSSKQIQTSSADNSTKRAEKDHSVMLVDMELGIFGSLLNDPQLSNFSSGDDTLHNILANSEDKLPWRLSVDPQALNRRESVNLHFLKSERQMEKEEKSRIPDDSDSYFSEDGDNSFYIHPKRVRESKGVRENATSDSEEEHPSAFVRYSRSSLENDVFLDDNRLDGHKHPQLNRLEQADGAKTPLRFAELEKERCIERFSRIGEKRGKQCDARQYQVVRSLANEGKDSNTVRVHSTARKTQHFEENKSTRKVIKCYSRAATQPTHDSSTTDVHCSVQHAQEVSLSSRENQVSKRSVDKNTSSHNTEETLERQKGTTHESLRNDTGNSEVLTSAKPRHSSNKSIPATPLKKRKSFTPKPIHCNKDRDEFFMVGQNRRMSTDIIPSTQQTPLKTLETDRANNLIRSDERLIQRTVSVGATQDSSCGGHNQIEPVENVPEIDETVIEHNDDPNDEDLNIPSTPGTISLRGERSHTKTPERTRRSKNKSLSKSSHDALESDKENQKVNAISETDGSGLKRLINSSATTNKPRCSLTRRHDEAVSPQSHQMRDTGDFIHKGNKSRISLTRRDDEVASPSKSHQMRDSGEFVIHKGNKSLVSLTRRDDEVVNVSQSHQMRDSGDFVIHKGNKSRISLTRRDDEVANVSQSHQMRDSGEFVIHKGNKSRISLTRRDDEVASPSQSHQMREGGDFVIHKSNKSLISWQHNQDVDDVSSPQKRPLPSSKTPMQNTSLLKRANENAICEEQNPADSGVQSQMDETPNRIGSSSSENVSETLFPKQNVRNDSESDVAVPPKQRKLSVNVEQASTKNKNTGRKTQETPKEQDKIEIANETESAKKSDNEIFKKPVGRPRSKRGSRTTSEFTTFSGSSINESGCRRSGRERRPAARRNHGVLLLTSERDFKKYVPYIGMSCSSIVADTSESWEMFRTVNSSNNSTRSVKSGRRTTKNSLPPIMESTEKKNAVPQKTTNKPANSMPKPKQLLRVVISPASTVREQNVEKITSSQMKPLRRNLASELDTPSSTQESPFSPGNMDFRGSTICTVNEEHCVDQFEGVASVGIYQEGDSRSTRKTRNDRGSKRPSKYCLRNSRNEPNTDEEQNKSDSDRLASRRLSFEGVPQNTDSISLSVNEETRTVKYVEHNSKFNPVDNVYMTDFTTHVSGGQMGYVKVPPGGRKPFRISQKVLLYNVVAGNGRVQLRNSIQNISYMSRFFIPSGTKYSIINLSDSEDLLLFCASTTS